MTTIKTAGFHGAMCFATAALFIGGVFAARIAADAVVYLGERLLG